MAYRDDADRVIRENEEIRAALAKARADARFTALRQVLLAFAFGLSWSILGDDASAMGRHDEPPFGYGWAQIRPNDSSATWVIDDKIPGHGDTRIALLPGHHRVRFNGPYGVYCFPLYVRDGRTTFAFDGYSRECR